MQKYLCNCEQVRQLSLTVNNLSIYFSLLQIGKAGLNSNKKHEIIILLEKVIGGTELQNCLD